ncbi:MAG: hypothetical protein CVV64_11945 [Candidatus Wallbacteria bacterium HGW-Wallbacteria-1]|jgi:hypothetical protein|uniref:pEK499-p136 HEPN domain-containing protein n=1 Tax=Candidatus Wallbacteria bacterium HGW-Wallbacteria-1 TaxID=2013854 RepID=A0A2N1PNV7_9BACT|nr:MAG: hypothetical protein CVV64_11945 [Candidatus Wallbacteria bacterium HGW-Wallbacteria-1]
MTEYSKDDFVKDFFKRTLHNLRQYDAKHIEDPKNYQYEVTQLINSFLGLVIFSKERNEVTSKELNEFIRGKFKSTYNNNKNSDDYCRHLRNAIAHRRIDSKSMPGANGQMIIHSLQFRDRNTRQKPVPEFSSNLTICEIKEFIRLLSKMILSETDYQQFYSDSTAHCQLTT